MSLNITHETTVENFHQFTLHAIDSLRKEPYKGIHTVYSGFNEAFRAWFDSDPIVVVTELADRGLIACRPAKKGAMIYRPEDKPAVQAGNPKATLAKMGLV